MEIVGSRGQTLNVRFFKFNQKISNFKAQSHDDDDGIESSSVQSNAKAKPVLEANGTKWEVQVTTTPPSSYRRFVAQRRSR